MFAVSFCLKFTKNIILCTLIIMTMRNFFGSPLLGLIWLEKLLIYFDSLRVNLNQSLWFTIIITAVWNTLRCCYYKVIIILECKQASVLKAKKYNDNIVKTEPH